MGDEEATQEGMPDWPIEVTYQISGEGLSARTHYLRMNSWSEWSEQAEHEGMWHCARLDVDGKLHMTTQVRKGSCGALELVRELPPGTPAGPSGHFSKVSRVLPEQSSSAEAERAEEAVSRQLRVSQSSLASDARQQILPCPDIGGIACTRTGAVSTDVYVDAPALELPLLHRQSFGTRVMFEMRVLDLKPLQRYERP
jgi:hypothetical protein